MAISTALAGLAAWGCEPATKPAPPTASTQPALAAPTAAPKPAEPAPTPTSPPANKPPAATKPVETAPKLDTAPKRDGEPDLSKLSDRTQRLIRDTRQALAEAPGSGDLPAKLGMIYLTNDMERESIPLFRTAIERVPSQASNWYYLGIALAATKDNAGAIEAFQKAVSIDKSLLFAHLRLADLLLATDKNAALAEYQEVDRLAPTTADTLVLLARGYDQLGKPDEALAACRKAVELEPRCPLGHAALADLLAKKGDEAGAAQHRKLAAYNGTCNMAPDMLLITAKATGHPIRAGIMRALALANQGNFDIAIRGLKNLSADDAMNLEIPLALGQVYQMQGDLVQAMREYGQVLQMTPGHLRAAPKLARAQIASGRLPDAEKTLKAALALHPDSPELLQALGIVQARTNRVDEAMATFRRAIELTKGDPDYQLEFARTLLDIKRLPDALKELEPLIDTPLRAKALITRSGIKSEQGDAKGAEEDLRGAMEADPTDPEPCTQLGVLLATIKQYDRAIAGLEDALKRHPNDIAIQNALAWLLATAPQASLRNGPRAVDLARKCCESTQFNLHAYLDTLAAALAEVGQFDTAVAVCQQAKEKATRGGDRQAANEYEARLGRYSASKPYRMPE